ncbi:hypothetical protein ACHHYP_20041 [Achlya hypogyna]|uniref:Uncharacterized protein n=1 Tax=Achlya hypogyna TaxID=1202772 RepID=A0A1V9Z9R8_ACHHY|nr:hypothetical protein ACHHYP_20041 [Achlya hypogyna]
MANDDDGAMERRTLTKVLQEKLPMAVTLLRMAMGNSSHGKDCDDSKPIAQQNSDTSEGKHLISEDTSTRAAASTVPTQITSTPPSTRAICATARIDTPLVRRTTRGAAAPHARPSAPSTPAKVAQGDATTCDDTDTSKIDKAGKPGACSPKDSNLGTAKRRKVDPNKSPTPSKTMSTPPSVVAKKKSGATKKRFLDRLHIDMKNPTDAVDKSKKRVRTASQFNLPPAEAPRRQKAPRRADTKPSPKPQRVRETPTPRAKGKRKLTFAAASSSSGEESAEEEAKPESAPAPDDPQGPVLHPWLVRHIKGKPLPEDWVWQMFDADYFQPLPASRFDELERLRRSVAALADPFMAPDTAPPGWVVDAHDPPFELPPRGRYYREVWDDEAFVADTGGGFRVIADHRELVVNYDDDLFEAYHCKLEGAADVLATDVLPDPERGEPPVADEIAVRLEQCIAQLVPQVLASWQTLQALSDHAREMAPFEAIHRQEQALVRRVERAYTHGRDALRAKVQARADPRMASRLRHMAPPQAAAFVYATRFARLLVVGDGVDFLDRTGLWEPATVVDAFTEDDELLTHIKVRVGPMAAQEWVSVYSGRLMPPGACSGRAAPVLDLNITQGPGGAYGVTHAKVVLPRDANAVAMARALETLRGSEA